MSARSVHAVLAAGIAHPELLDVWCRDAATLDAHGIDPGTLDFDALRKFCGLTMKVRHNGVRSLLPASFRFMSLAGLEIELFAAYAADASWRAEAPRSNLERARRLVAFVETWRNESSDNRTLLRDLIRHEYAIAILMVKAASFEAECGARGALHVCGRLECCELTSDPKTLLGALSARVPRWDPPDGKKRYVGYWRPPKSASVRVVELDAASYHLLTLVDGRRTVADLAELVYGVVSGKETALQRVLDKLRAAGLITFAPRPATS